MLIVPIFLTSLLISSVLAFIFHLKKQIDKTLILYGAEFYLSNILNLLKVCKTIKKIIYNLASKKDYYYYKILGFISGFENFHFKHPLTLEFVVFFFKLYC